MAEQALFAQPQVVLKTRSRGCERLGSTTVKVIQWWVDSATKTLKHGVELLKAIKRALRISAAFYSHMPDKENGPNTYVKPGLKAPNKKRCGSTDTRDTKIQVSGLIQLESSMSFCILKLVLCI